ncbi:hypothetical protein HFO63_12375 [Rhizobium laguerreae]|nr:hypothetical protein [Rhizobium laguerreae]MBY3086236.1 hypothetical protein [Rhizobium laguerreae]MBY3146372.1 hypothetical protein [Rhizobium laguerreae]MBY3277480.1 hypothetical protein [Rhizobium laguerreae]
MKPYSLAFARENALALPQRRTGMRPPSANYGKKVSSPLDISLMSAK